MRAHASPRPLSAVDRFRSRVADESEAHEVFSLHTDLSGATDAELVGEVKRRNRAAAGVLFARYQSHVTRVLVRMLGPSADVPDLVQESFLRGFRGMKRLESVDSLSGWFTRVATYTALDFLRAKKRRSWLDFLPTDRLDVPREAESRSLEECVYAVLEIMPPKERDAICLRYLEGLEQAELAEALDCSVATAKRRVEKAKKRFERLARQDPVLMSFGATGAEEPGSSDDEGRSR